jgi:hypothetical protein
MKSHIELWSLALEELGDRCSVSTAADLETIRRRYEHEGDKLFTVALPAFGKDFERSLSLGHIPDDGFVGWGRRSKFSESYTDQLLFHSPIPVGKPPKFLGGFLDRVFDAANGALFDAYPGLYTEGSDIESIHAIRQLTLAFGKLKVLPDQEQIDQAYDRFIEVDAEVTRHLDYLCEVGAIPLLPEELKGVLNCVFGDALSAVNQAIYDGELQPRHGPGATADRKLGNQKYYQSEWTDRMEVLFPYVEYALPNHRYHYKQQDVTWLSPEQERPVRVIAVPKTAKTPRIIAIEPVCMQYMQQAVSAKFVEKLESRRLPKEKRDNLASYFVGFTEQWPNQAMAQIGSEDGSLATLDLSDASDRVPNWLVEALFEDYPWFSEAIQVCRSSRANVPGHGIITLSKYASMGSALTFPVEAVVFATIALWAISSRTKLPEQPYSYSQFNRLRDKVRVYGDDIIVPSDYAVPVIDALEAFGLKVNRSKSFWTGKFRESCGKEYYNGSDVSIVRYRKSIPTLQARAPGDWVEQIQSTVSTRNQFYMAGMWKTAGALDEVLETCLKGWYPYVEESSPVLGRVSLVFGYDVSEYHPDTQSPLVKGYVPSSKLPSNAVANEEALLKCLLKGNHSPELIDSLKGLFPEDADKKHLTHSGRPRAASIKLVKAPPY